MRTDAHPRSDAADMLRGNAFMLLSTIFFGVNVPVVKVLIPGWLSWMDVTTVRFVFAAILMLLTSLFIRNDRIERRDWWRLIVAGMCCLFPFIFLFCLSLNYGSAIDISIILTFPPMFVIAIGALFMHRRVSKTELLGIVVALCGALLVILGQGNAANAEAKAPRPILGDLIALASCILYAVYLILMEQPSKKYKPITLTRWVLLLAAVPCIPLLPSLFHSHLFADPQTTPVLLAAFIVVGPTYLSYLLVAPAIKLVGSEIVSLYQYLVPVVATVAAVLMGIDRLQWYQPVAIVIIFAGVWLTNRGKRRREAAAAAQ